MLFNYALSTRKALLDYYDGIPTILIQTYKEQDFLLYVTEWDIPNNRFEYMLATIEPKDIRLLSNTGVKAFLQSKLNDTQLLVLTCDIWSEQSNDQLRSMAQHEAESCFPEDEFKLNYNFQSIQDTRQMGLF